MQGRALTVLTLATGLATIPTHAATTQIDGGRTSVALDFETLESVGLAVSGVSADVLVPGTLEGSVAFTVNTRTDDLPSTFAYDAGDFLGTFNGTIEHAGSVFFNDGTLEVGDFTIGFDAARVSGTTSGFFVESTSGLVAILFDVATPQSLVVTANGIEVGADLLVSPELDGALGGMGALTGADVGDALVEAVGYTVRTRVVGGETFGDTSRTNVLLDLELLSTVGLSLSSVSDEVIAPGGLGDGSVAFPVNNRIVDDGLPTTFSYEAADFIETFAGTIEHAGVVRFNKDTLEVGDFSIGFDPDRIMGNASGFFVASTTGLQAVLFDIAAPSMLEAGEELLVVAADLLVSPELDGVLGGKGGLTGVDVGDALVEALAITSPQLDATITQAITDLMPFSADRDVNKAIERLEDALATFDGDEPTDRVFKELAKAVKELDDGEGFGGVIESLRLASRAVAIGAFREGFIGGGDSRDLLKALKELQKGDRDSWNGKPDKAIQAYGKSWERSRDSLS